MYLDTPLVGPTQEPLEYVPLPGRLGRPSRYPPSSTGPQSGSARRRPALPPPPYNTHPRMHATIGWAQPRRVVHGTGLGEKLEILAPRGEPLAKFRSAALERPNPPTHTYEYRGEGREVARGPERPATGPEKKRVLENRGEPLAKFWSQGSGSPQPPTHANRHRGDGREEIVGTRGTATSPGKIGNSENRGEPLATF